MIPQSEAQPPMGELGRLANVFVDPYAAFADIAARPRFWVPLILVMAMSLVFVTAIFQHVGAERMVRQALEASPRAQNLSAEEREKAIEVQMKIVPVTMFAGAVLGPPAMLLIVAGVMALVFKVMMGAAISFKQLFAIAAYSWLPGMVGGAAALAVLFLKSPDDFNLQNPTAFNPGAFLDAQSTPKWLMSLATSTNLFTLWTIVLLAVGVSMAARKVGFGKALAGVAIPWLLVVFARAGIVAAFS